MNNRKYLSLFVFFIATVVATYTVLRKNDSVENGKLYPWNQPAIVEMMSEEQKNILTDKAKILNTLIDGVEKDEAKLKEINSPEKPSDEEIIKKRKEISGIYEEMYYIHSNLVPDTIRKKPHWSYSVKFVADSFQALSTTSLQINSPLTKIGEY
jgi:hypothetical protein